MNPSLSVRHTEPTPARRTPRPAPHSDASETRPFAPWVAALRIWLVAGCAACVLIPAARGIDAWFGWLPFWLVVAPALDLLVLRRARLSREAATWLGRIARRRTWHHQARRLQRHGSRRRRAAPADAGART